MTAAQQNPNARLAMDLRTRRGGYPRPSWSGAPLIRVGPLTLRGYARKRGLLTHFSRAAGQALAKFGGGCQLTAMRWGRAARPLGLILVLERLVLVLFLGPAVVVR